MKTMKKLFGLLLMLGLIRGLTGCSNDDEIYFTQDEIVQGDIATGKEIKVKTLEVGTTESQSVYVRGGKGDLTVSTDPLVVECRLEQSSGKWYLVIKGITAGEAVITVTDSEGNSSSLSVSVIDVERLWKKTTYFQNLRIERKCMVRGVSPADSAVIVSSVLSNDKEASYVVKMRTFPPSVLYRLVIRDAEENVLTDAEMDITTNSMNEGEEWWGARMELYQNYEEGLLATYYYYQNNGEWFVKDLTKAYQTEYPNVTEVLLFKPVAKIIYE
ncbi:MAG: hypothetical protein IJ456_04590 [Bacteroides sp.]|nr:hypothetical protein [Bacteroides sp.]